MQPFVSGITNATGLALDAQGYLYVSSRLDGTVHRVSPQGASSVYAEGMGIATGIAFDSAGNLYVGDRSGTIFKIAQDRQIFVFATLEPSIAAYHLAFGLDGTLFVTAPSTSSYDSIYAIDQAGVVRVYYRGLGRPQGLAFDVAGNVYVSASFPRHPRHCMHYSWRRSLRRPRRVWYCWSRFRSRRQRDPGCQWRGL